MNRRHYTSIRLTSGKQYYTRTDDGIDFAIMVDDKRFISFTTGEYIKISDCRWWFGAILNKNNCEAATLRDEIEILELESGRVKS